MKKHFKKLIIASIFVILILGNPSERRFLHALQKDYGNVHQGMNLGVEELVQMGEVLIDLTFFGAPMNIPLVPFR